MKMRSRIKTTNEIYVYIYIHQYYRTRRWRKFQKWKTYRRGELVWRKNGRANPLRKSAAWAPNISAEDASCTAPATKNASVQIIFQSPTPAIVFENATKPSPFSHFSVDAQSTPPATQNDVWTSKMSPRPSVFNTFDFEMCFAPQHRALFRHLNFQKC